MIPTKSQSAHVGCATLYRESLLSQPWGCASSDGEGTPRFHGLLTGHLDEDGLQMLFEEILQQKMIRSILRARAGQWVLRKGCLAKDEPGLPRRTKVLQSGASYRWLGGPTSRVSGPGVSQPLLRLKARGPALRRFGAVCHNSSHDSRCALTKAVPTE